MLGLHMKDNQKTSIIIPIYNTAKWLSECLDSVINQSEKEIEIICINDGSTDNSAEILKKYSENDNRIKIITQENKGLSAARNAGLETATGKYIYFLDSDDKLADRNIIRILEDKMLKNNLDFIYGEADVIYDNNNLEEKFPFFKKNYKIKNIYKEIMKGIDAIKCLRIKNDYYEPVSLKFFSYEFLKINNIYFIKDQIHEDSIFTYKVFLLANNIMILNSPIYIRRIRENSIMTSFFSAVNLHGWMITFVDSMEFLLKNNYFDIYDQEICFLPYFIKNMIIDKYIKLDKNEKDRFLSKLNIKQKNYFDFFIRDIIKIKTEKQY